MKKFFTFLLCIFGLLVSLVLYQGMRQKFGIHEAEAAPAEKSMDQVIAEVNQKVEEKQAQARVDAMLHGTAAVGMAKFEVYKSMGEPESTELTSSVTEEPRHSALLKLQAFETLNYYQKDTMVLLDVNGIVVLVTGYKK